VLEDVELQMTSSCPEEHARAFDALCTAQTAALAKLGVKQ
jgi:hypothetical protein